MLVELLLDKKPFEWVDKSVWAANNRYYVDGHSNAVLNSTYQTVNADDIVPLMLTFIKANRDKLNYLKNEAHDFIRNAAKKFNEENIVVSFSEVKGYTAAANLAVKALSNPFLMRPVTRVIIQERKEMILGWTPQTALPGNIARRSQLYF